MIKQVPDFARFPAHNKTEVFIGDKMAHIFRFSGYCVDPNGDFDSESVEQKIVYALEFTQQLHIEESNEFEWDDDLPVNSFNCDMAHLEKYFDSNLPADASRTVEIGKKYRHFKEGKIVEVLAISRNTERVNDVTVVYRCEDGRVWNRPYDMFISEVDHKKYPNANQKYRFEKIS